MQSPGSEQHALAALMSPISRVRLTPRERALGSGPASRFSRLSSDAHAWGIQSPWLPHQLLSLPLST